MYVLSRRSNAAVELYVVPAQHAMTSLKQGAQNQQLLIGNGISDRSSRRIATPPGLLKPSRTKGATTKQTILIHGVLGFPRLSTRGLPFFLAHISCPSSTENKVNIGVSVLHPACVRRYHCWPYISPSSSVCTSLSLLADQNGRYTTSHEHKLARYNIRYEHLGHRR